MKTVAPSPSCATRSARRAARGASIGLVPTMGSLHEGHVSLIRQRARRCDVVVVSLFVNPTQFDDAGDLAAYPRDEARDAALGREAGADILFAPPPTRSTRPASPPRSTSPA